MTSPRYVVVKRWLLGSRQTIWVVRDTVRDVTLTGHSFHKRKMEKRADKYNAAILVEAEKYRKAKDNG